LAPFSTPSCSPCHGEHVGVSPVVRDLTVGEIPAVNATATPGDQRVGSVDPSGPAVSRSGENLGADLGCTQHCRRGFHKGLMKLISRKWEKASKNHILRFMTLKIMK
jgi:hypothetical protein